MTVIEFREANPWFDRMFKEIDELEDKLNKLKNSLDNEEFVSKLSVENRLALMTQFDIMASYLSILSLRLTIIIKENNLKDN